MHPEFIAAYACPAAGLINPDRNADLFLSKTQGFTALSHATTNDRG
jgi:hypothetical protein